MENCQTGKTNCPQPAVTRPVSARRFDEHAGPLAERQPAGVVLSVGSARLGQIYESILAARRLQTVTARRDDESRIELGFWKSSSRVLWVSAPFWHPLSICLRDPTECSSN